MGGIETRKPPWIRFSIPAGESYKKVNRVLKQRGLKTICAEAHCPNIGECFGCGTATFMILGPRCTRNCRYCSVAKGVPSPPLPDEPEMVAMAVAELHISYAVITSVTRDDLEDGGASFFVNTVNRIRELCGSCKTELLVPDFAGTMEPSIEKIIQCAPDMINHNIEVAGPLFSELRPLGDYGLSLRLLARVSAAGMKSKSGLMVGFGETLRDIELTLRELHVAGCRHLTVGQYLQSTKDNYPVKKYYTPDEFSDIRSMAEEIGFDRVLSGPLVRSSYHAAGFHGQGK